MIGLAEQREPSGPFAALHAHPAVAKVREMLRKADQRALPAQLMLYVSTPPALALSTPAPGSYAILAGGQDALDEFYAAARDFALRADFSRYYESQLKSYEGLSRRHSQRLKALAPSAGRLIVSSLLPKRYWARLVRIPRASSAEVWTLISSDLLGESGAFKASAMIEISMKVDPRIELLSVLRLLHPQPGILTGPRSPYRQDAARWFSSFSTHPAVAQTAALFEHDHSISLPAQLVLHLSEPPDMYAQDSIAGGYLDAAGGEEAVDRYIEALGDFAKRSRFADFYAAHRGAYREFAAEAEKEASASISPKAVQAYLGMPMSDRYYFPLAPLLSEQDAVSFSLQHYDRVEEVRLRPARYTTDLGTQFLFNHFGSSLAHELVHTVTNPLVSSFDPKGAKAPAGCNDQMGGDWSGCIQEHLVYAVTLRILAQELGEPIYEELADKYRRRGFPYLVRLGERLKEYEADRGRYKALKDFYPKLEPIFAESLPKTTPRAPSPFDPKARRLKDEGVNDFVAGRFPDAEKKFKEALSLSANDAEALLNLGVVYEKLSLTSKALESYDLAIKVGSLASARDRDIQVAALSSRATLLAALGHAAQARRDLIRVLEVAPYDWEGRPAIERRLGHE